MSGFELRTLECGMGLVVEHVPGSRSACMVWQLPVGTSGDPEGDAGEGESTMLSELLLRGSGGLSSREFAERLDRLGVERHSGATPHHTVVSASMLGSRLEEALPLFCGMVRRPAIEEDAVEAVRAISLAALAGLEDDPAHVAGLKLTEISIPAPFNRNGYGTEAGLRRASAESLRQAWARRCVPGMSPIAKGRLGSILAIAGEVRTDAVAAILDRELAGWAGEAPEPTLRDGSSVRKLHYPLQTGQTQIALAFPGPKACDPDAAAFRLGMLILGGAPSSRLFTEVREKRSLCYSVRMGAVLGRDLGFAEAFAGSTNERAPETLSCMREEIARFAEGVTREEFDSAKVAIRSRIVMRGEGTASRASTLAREMFLRGKPRSLAEELATTERIEFEEFNLYLRQRLGPAWRAEERCVVVGPRDLG